MHALTFSSISLILWTTFITTTPTLPASLYLSVQNNSTDQLSVSSFAPITDNESNLNVTASHQEEGGKEYHIPNTSLTLYINLGFACNETALRSTIIGARDHCQDQAGATSEPPRVKLSFDFGYGIDIIIVNTRPQHRLSWAILDMVLSGMWEYLIVDSRYTEVTFDVFNTENGLVGRGQIETAAPWLSVL